MNDKINNIMIFLKKLKDKIIVFLRKLNDSHSERKYKKAQEKSTKFEERIFGVQGKSMDKEAKNKMAQELIEEIEVAGYAMSQKYRYHKLLQASNLKEKDNNKEGLDVHGWMQRRFLHRYQWLINNDVFDYALNYALKYFRPEIFNNVSDYDFDNAIINLITLPKKDHFDLFPRFEFDKFIVLTQGQSFENIVYWQENYETEDENGYLTTMTRCVCYFLNSGFTLWDLPVLILQAAVGMNKIFFEAKTTGAQLASVHDNILKSYIYKKRQEEKTVDEKYMELEDKYDQLKDRYQFFRDDVEANDIRDPEEKLRDFEKKYYDTISHKPPNYKKVVVIIVIFALIAFLIMSIITSSTPKPPVDSEFPIISGILTNIFNGC